jgi:hypothetical protein
MFGLGPIQLLGLLVLVLLFEIVLFWASVSLADGPETRLPKCALAGALVVAVCLPSIALVFFVFRLWDVWWSGEALAATLCAFGLSLLLAWALPALLYVPLVPVSVAKGMKVAVLQWLLRAFLYALVAAVVFVGLAVAQIIRGGGDATPPAARLAPPVAAVEAFSRLP